MTPVMIFAYGNLVIWLFCLRAKDSLRFDVKVRVCVC